MKKFDWTLKYEPLIGEANNDILNGIGKIESLDAKFAPKIVKLEQSNRATFSQIIIENILYITNRHPKYLSTAEFSLVFKLCAFTCKIYNKLVKYETRTGYGYKNTLQNANISFISNFIGQSRSYTSKLIKSLRNKGIIYEDSEFIIEDTNNRKTNAAPMYLNPEICYQGNRKKIMEN